MEDLPARGPQVEHGVCRGRQGRGEKLDNLIESLQAIVKRESFLAVVARFPASTGIWQTTLNKAKNMQRASRTLSGKLFVSNTLA